MSEDAINERLARIERKLDALIAALADDEDVQAPERTLDGEPAGAERSPLGSLD